MSYCLNYEFSMYSFFHFRSDSDKGVINYLKDRQEQTSCKRMQTSGKKSANELNSKRLQRMYSSVSNKRPPF